VIEAFKPSRLETKPLPQAISWLRHERSPEYEWLGRKSRNVSQFSGLLQALNSAKSMLELPDDWDDAGSPAIQEQTLRRAGVLLILHAALIWARFSVVMPTPRILPGPEGSVDLHWKTRRRELLINVPRDPQVPVPYYGDDLGSDRKKGMLHPNAINLELFAWLTAID
jgi:hypothetical protein